VAVSSSGPGPVDGPGQLWAWFARQEFRGYSPLCEDPPPIAPRRPSFVWRVGLDREPVDLSDPDDALADHFDLLVEVDERAPAASPSPPSDSTARGPIGQAAVA
jgi:hypothetical protein